MKSRIYILGAGGFGREVYQYLLDSGTTIDEIVGFLDDNSSALSDYNCKHQVIGDLFNFKLPKGALLIMAVANPSLKKQLYDFYKPKHYNFKTLIHPSAVIGGNVSVGEGSIICPHVTVTTDISIGKLCTVNAHSSIGHDAKLGDFCTLSGHCDVTGFANLDDEVFMGSHALVIPNVKVGRGAVIGAGSVVISKVRPGITVFGNPAKKIK